MEGGVAQICFQIQTQLLIQDVFAVDQRDPDQNKDNVSDGHIVKQFIGLYLAVSAGEQEREDTAGTFFHGNAFDNVIQQDTGEHGEHQVGDDGDEAQKLGKNGKGNVPFPILHSKFKCFH